MSNTRTSPKRSTVVISTVFTMLVLVVNQLAQLTLPPAFHMAAPQVLDRPAGSQAHAVVVDNPQKSRSKNKGNETIMNLTLQLGSGWGDVSGVHLTNGASWATCFVEYDDASQSSSMERPQGRQVLEQWVMRGDRENVDAFRQFQQKPSGADPVSVRCAPTSVKATKEVLCLECVSHVGRLPFTPASSILPGSRSRSSVTTLANPGMIFGNLQQCLETALGGKGFCKSGSLSVPL